MNHAVFPLAEKDAGIIRPGLDGKSAVSVFAEPRLKGTWGDFEEARNAGNLMFLDKDAALSLATDPACATCKGFHRKDHSN